MNSSVLEAQHIPLHGRQLIEASAGTGKTYNITKLYVRLVVESKLPVQEILVMTFTLAATQELRDRIGREIRDAIGCWQTGAAADDKFYQVLCARISAETALPLLRQALLDLDEAAIYTIHSFCRRALSDQAFAAGLPFNLQLDTDQDAENLEAVRDWYRELGRQPEIYALNNMGLATPDQFYSTFHRLILSESGICSGVEKAAAGLAGDWLSEWTSEKPGFNKQLAENGRFKHDKQVLYQNYRDQLDHLCQHPDPEHEEQVLAELWQQADFTKEAKVKHYPTLAAAAAVAGARQKQKQAELIISGILWCRQSIRDTRLRRHQMDFDDLIRLLAEQLKRKGGQQLARLLESQYPAALVDEFQDTDNQQYQILDHIYQSENSLLLMIGDPKQAIYSFRGGDIFAYLLARSQANQVWRMGTNHRSLPKVVADYNYLFGINKDCFDFGISYEDVEAGIDNPIAIKDPSGAVDGISWLRFPGDDWTKDKMSVLADWTSAEISRILCECQLDSQPVNAGDIAILVRDRHEASVMRTSLARAGLSAVYLSNRDSVWQSYEAIALGQCLQGIYSPENSSDLAACLSSHWFGLSVEQIHQLQTDDASYQYWYQYLAELKVHWQNKGLLSMAFRIMHSHYSCRPDQELAADPWERRLTNDLHLLELLQQQNSKLADPLELILWLQEQLDHGSAEAELRLESDENLIRLVTMHGAKGLEYPIVFLPFVCYGRLAKKNDFLCRRHDPVSNQAESVIYPQTEDQRAELREQQAELVRLFYVAVTRAVNRAYILAAPFQQFRSSMLGQTTGCGNITDLAKVISLETASDPTQAGLTVQDNTEKEAKLEPARFSGRIERDWWLSSFSALTRNRRHDGLSLPDRQDETQTAEAPEPASLPLRFRLAKGAQSGNLLHWLMEHWLMKDNHNDRMQLIPAVQRTFPDLIADDDVEALAAWAGEITAAPLSSEGTGEMLTLGILSESQILAETEFYFPMQIQSGQAGIFNTILNTDRERPSVLPDQHRLQGMMHGFIDLIFEWQGRYYVADYKSNWLGDQLDHYNMAAMQASIEEHYYDLQYWLYSLALHRYLAVRLENYQPEVHLGGVYYLYLRGMTPGSDNGVWHRKLDVERLLQLDKAFAGEDS